MFILPADSQDFRFPPVELASPEGLLAIGGDLRSERLLEAYRHGIFPWYNKGQPILWWSPDPRAVLLPPKLRISRSLRKTLRKGEYVVTLDTQFLSVINACAKPRVQNLEGGTWITPEMIEAYFHLYEQGYAHSVETWFEGTLVGGLYGVALGGIFFGESMFSQRPNASKFAFVHLVRQLEEWGYTHIDCQLPSAHLSSLGTEEIRRQDFLRMLDHTLALPDRLGAWQFDSKLTLIK